MIHSHKPKSFATFLAKSTAVRPNYSPIQSFLLAFFLLITAGAIFIRTGFVYAQSSVTDAPAVTATENITTEIITTENPALVGDEALADLEEPIFFDVAPIDNTVDPNEGSVAVDAPSDETVVAAVPLAGANQMYLPSISAVEPEEITTASGITYYVNCTGGSDSNSGRTTGDAWKTLTRANKATLQPGDRLLFKRGCAWIGPLRAKWRGTASLPIVIGAYGSGDLPRFQNAYLFNVWITGSYQIIENLHATLTTPPDPDPNCRNQPRGWKAGFSFTDSASYNTIRTSKATKFTVGVYFDISSHHNKLLNSTITDNNVLERLTATSAHGATGVSLHGDANEIGRNYFANNRSICTYNGVVESNSIELYRARNSNIHHNRSFGDRVFSELGTDSTYRAENNTFAYNLHVNSYSHSTMGTRFLVTRGYGHSFGPILNTKLYNNVIYLTGSGSKGVTCQKCGTGILTMRSNTLWANDEPFSSDAAFVESNNLFWSSNGDPMLRWRGLSQSPSSRVANPQFVDTSTNNFKLRSTSPAINKASIDVVTAGFSTDLAGNTIPAGGTVDIGSYEYVAP